MKNITVIGSGFSGLSAAAFLAKDGYSVTLLEKNSTVGGRALQIFVLEIVMHLGLYNHA